MASLAGLSGTEHQHQVTVVSWALLNERKIPELALLYAIPNGGKRDARVAAKLKMEGVKAGVLDLNLPVARGGYLGLWIEMKSGTNGLTASQDRWLRDLVAQGHMVAVCWTAEVAIKILETYLEGKWALNTLDPVGVTGLSSSSLPVPRYRISRRVSLSSAAPLTPAA